MNQITVQQITTLTNNLRDVLSTKKMIADSIIDNVNFANAILKQTKNLEHIIINVKGQIDQEQKELDAAELKLAKISKLSKLSKQTLYQEDNLLLIAEGQSMVESIDSALFANYTTQLNEEMLNCIEELTNILLSRKIPNNFEEVKAKLPVKKVALPKVQPNAAKGRGSPKKFSPKKKPEKKEVASKEAEKPLSVKKIKNDLQNAKDSATKLLGQDKKCERCLESTKNALILGTDCVLCIPCIKEVAKLSGKLLYNTYEAHKSGRDTVCACNVHGSPISPQMLLILFGNEAVEEASIESLRSQIKHSKKMHPILCAECRNVVEKGTDPKEAVSICIKHNLCIKCFR